MNGRTVRHHRGVTLLEIMLAMGLLALLTSATLWFYDSALDERATGSERARRMRLARVTLDRIAREIRQASVVAADDRAGIRGEAERIWLTAIRMPSRKLIEETSFFDEPVAAEFDLVKVEYRIARHPEIQHEDGYDEALGLARVAHLIPRPDSAETGAAFEDEFAAFLEPMLGTGGEATAPDGFDDAYFDEVYDEADEGDEVLGFEVRWDELYAPEIRYLRFCYYDGAKWWDDWNIAGENPLPQLVLVTIGFEQQAPFGEEFGTDDDEAEDFCECLNDEILECLRLPDDQVSTIVRVPQADPFFRSRVTREAQGLVEQITGGAGEEEESGEGGKP